MEARPCPGWWLVLLAVLVIAVDQASKQWLMEYMAARHFAPLPLSEYFSLVMAWNRGVSFSMLSSEAAWMPYLLAALAVGVSLLLARLARRSTNRSEAMAYALVIGGALANAADRLRFGAVPDFFYAHIGRWGWPAFNVADMAICAGVGLLLFTTLKGQSRS